MYCIVMVRFVSVTQMLADIFLVHVVRGRPQAYRIQSLCYVASLLYLFCLHVVLMGALLVSA